MIYWYSPSEHVLYFVPWGVPWHRKLTVWGKSVQIYWTMQDQAHQHYCQTPGATEKSNSLLNIKVGWSFTHVGWSFMHFWFVNECIGLMYITSTCIKQEFNKLFNQLALTYHKTKGNNYCTDMFLLFFIIQKVGSDSAFKINTCK